MAVAFVPMTILKGQGKMAAKRRQWICIFVCKFKSIYLVIDQLWPRGILMRSQTGRHEYGNIMQNMPLLKKNFSNVFPILLMAYDV